MGEENHEKSYILAWR